MTDHARLTEEDLAAVDAIVAPADAALASAYPGDDGSRQPVHTVYVPADRVTDDVVGEWGQAALAALAQHAPSASAIADATGLDRGSVGPIWPRLLAKLEAEPIEDLRVDFEDGYGTHLDAEEDAHAQAAAGVLARITVPWRGIRFASMEAPTRRRGLRTLDLVLGGVLSAGGLPEGWVVTLPKVTSAEQVVAMVETCCRLERAHGLPNRRLRFEVQVETPQAVIGADGAATVAAMLHAGDGRVTGLHYGTYDYSASLGIAAAYQSMEHPAADHAKAVMQAAAAGTGVRLSDGSTNVLPVGSRDQVRDAWRLHARLVRRSLERGFYQGWDLHPAQLPTRYLATYAFFREGLPAASSRLRAYLDRADSGVLDEPATAKALAGFVLRGLDCGAVDDDEVKQLSGLDHADLVALARPAAAGSVSD